MKYTKPSLSFEQQADLLISRGLLVNKRSNLVDILKAVSYCRLSAYWQPFIENTGNTWCFKKGTTLDMIWNPYRFDRQLRVLFVDAIERIEIAIRSQLVTLYTLNKSPFAYADEHFSDWADYKTKVLQIEERGGFLNGINGKKKCELPFVRDFLKKYGDSHQHLPFWLFIDFTDFGFLTLFLKNSDSAIINQISSNLALPTRVLKSWLRSLNTLRNKCAHHCRIWDITWGTPIVWPDMCVQREWFYSYSSDFNKWILPPTLTSPPSFPNNRTVALFFICRYLLKRVAPNSQWFSRVEKLFDDFTNKGVDIRAMGFPTKDWQSHPIWSHTNIARSR
jgi:abortive infection bacteriophage resistance protein